MQAKGDLTNMPTGRVLINQEEDKDYDGQVKGSRAGEVAPRRRPAYAQAKTVSPS